MIHSCGILMVVAYVWTLQALSLQVGN